MRRESGDLWLQLEEIGEEELVLCVVDFIVEVIGFN